MQPYLFFRVIYMKLKFIYLKIKKMKKIYSLVLIVLFAFMAKESVAQTSVLLYSDSTGFFNYFSCSRTVHFGMHIGGITTGYNAAQDSIRVKLFFGDGSDTTYKTNLYSNGPSQLFYLFIPDKYHIYSSTGAYNIKIKAIGPDNKADSVMHENYLVGNSCSIIKGYLYSDLDNSCSYNTGDGPISGYPIVNLNYGSQLLDKYYTHPLDSSRYNFTLPDGFIYNISVENNINLSFCPGMYNISTPAAHKDFGLSCTGSQHDLTGTIATSGGFYTPGSSKSVNCMTFNMGCTAISGKMKLLFDNALLTFVNATGTYTLVGDTVIWNFTNLDNYILTGSNFTAVANFTIATSAVSGDIITYKLIETPVSNDIDPLDNIQTTTRIVGTSYDPNDKAVLPQGEGVPGYVQKNINMIYTIRFQNTGTAPAENIYVIDSIDNNLDLNSFALLNHSHDPQITFLSGRVVKFNFPYIYLPDSSSDYNGSQGYVQFALKQNHNLAENTEIKNHAYIYFDYNAPVKTNTVLNTINYTIGMKENIMTNENFSVYPNPNGGKFIMNFENLTGKALIDVYNMTGQLILSDELSNSLVKTIDLSKQAKGIYLVKVKTDNYSSSEKIIIE